MARCGVACGGVDVAALESGTSGLKATFAHNGWVVFARNAAGRWATSGDHSSRSAAEARALASCGPDCAVVRSEASFDTTDDVDGAWTGTSSPFAAELPSTAQGPSLCSSATACMTVANDAYDQDRAKSRMAYERACELGAARGCNGAAVFYEKGDSVPLDHAKAYGFFKRGCDGRDPQSCGWAGVFEMKGQYAPLDPKRGIDHLGFACDGDDPGSCQYLQNLCKDGVRDACTRINSH